MYKNLVFKGGGVKSFAYIGALEVLEETGLLRGIEKVAGSSAGAIYAMMVGLNFTANEVKSSMQNISIKVGVEDCNSSDVLDRFFSHYGRYNGEDSIQSLQGLILSKVSDAGFTFQDLHKAAQSSSGFKDVYITGVDLTDDKLVVFSHETTPDMRLLDAVRISCSYPLMYTPVVGGDGHYYIDGGLLDNYPVFIFDKNVCESDELCVSNPETLGLFLGSPEGETALGVSDIQHLIKNIADKFCSVDREGLQAYLDGIDCAIDSTAPVDTIVAYIGKLFHIYSLAEHRKHNVDEILISGEGYNALDLNISDQQINDLVVNGVVATEEFMRNNHSADFDPVYTYHEMPSVI